jgi:mannose-1-phosphate guanylyltransferase/phosphomannomutase
MKVDTIVVLAGGKGTRSLNPSIPKITQRISQDKDVASFLLENLAAFKDARVLWLISHLADEVVERISPLQANHSVFFDEGRGTSIAVASALSVVPGKNVMIVLGDCLMGIPLLKVTDGLLDEHATHFFGRITDHPLDSDCLVLDVNSQVKGFSTKGDQKNRAEGISFGLSGITVTNRENILYSLDETDIQFQIYKNSKALGKKVNLVKNSWYVRDTGTPERLLRAQVDFSSGSFKARSTLNRGAIFLDRDGTIIPNVGEGRTHIKKGEVSVSASKALKYANSQGVPVILMTNQPGLAKGFIGYEDFENTISDLLRELDGAFLDDFYFCPHHPEAGWPGERPELKMNCDCRKPNIGMLSNACKEHLLQISSCFLIGDSEADRIASERAGCRFLFAEWSESGESLSQAIYQAVREIRNAYL